MKIYNKLHEFLEKGIRCMTVTVVEKKGEGPVEVGKKMLVTEDGEAFGTVGGGAIEYEARERCRKLIKAQRSIVIKYILDEGRAKEEKKTLPMKCGGEVSLFFEYIGAKANIYIFGGGHVGKALVNILKTMNYYVVVIDSRLEVLKGIEGADRKVNKPFIAFIEEEGIKENSYIVVCTPSHEFDYKVLDKVIEMSLKPRYMGMLCSQKKLENYLKGTKEKFGEDIDLSNFYSPIGLDIGGNSPEEIAVSIVSEILAIQHNKEGHKHMRGD